MQTTSNLSHSNANDPIILSVTVNPAPEATSIKLYEHSGHLVTSSRNVAAVFGREHGLVLAGIHRLQLQLSEIETARESDFFERDSSDTEESYHITRMGLSLLIAGYAGRDALPHKLDYFNAFNAYELKRAGL